MIVLRYNHGMRDNRSSITASLVAFVRAVYTAAPPALNVAPDPVARALLPTPLRQAAVLLERSPAAGALLRPMLRIASAGLFDHVALRTAAIDDALRAKLGAGVRQLVLLGAGLDARPYRLPDLAGVRVFEVDHPATQRFKRARVAGLVPCAREVRYVPVDFERDSLAGELAAAGHDAAQLTFWIWEGVTMYLHPAAIDATLAQIATRSAPGSIIAVTYATPELLRTLGMGPVLSRATRLAARAVGEPLRGLMSSDEFAARLRSAGFEVRSDTSAVDWAPRYWPARAARRVRSGERLVIAERTLRA